MSATQKRVWPELVGKDVNAVVKILKEESGFDDIRVMRDDSKITCAFDPTQITVYINEKNIVTVEPRIG